MLGVSGFYRMVRAGVDGAGLWHGEHPRAWTDRAPGNMVCDRGQETGSPSIALSTCSPGPTEIVVTAKAAMQWGSRQNLVPQAEHDPAALAILVIHQRTRWRRGDQGRLGGG